MPSQNQHGESCPYDGDTDLRILHEGNDLEIASLIKGLTGQPERREHNMMRAQKLIKEESMNQDRRWVKRKLKRKIKELGEVRE